MNHHHHGDHDAYGIWTHWWWPGSTAWPGYHSNGNYGTKSTFLKRSRKIIEGSTFKKILRFLEKKVIERTKLLFLLYKIYFEEKNLIFYSKKEIKMTEIIIFSHFIYENVTFLKIVKYLGYFMRWLGSPPICSYMDVV